MYKIKNSHKNKSLITPVDGLLYSLTATERGEVKIPATKSEAERIKIIHVAGQDILKKLYEDDKYGNFSRIIEKVEGTEAEAAKVIPSKSEQRKAQLLPFKVDVSKLDLENMPEKDFKELLKKSEADFKG